jgi:hypothetical protein
MNYTPVNILAPLIDSKDPVDIYQDGQLVATVRNGTEAYFYIAAHSLLSVSFALKNGWSLTTATRPISHERVIGSMQMWRAV